MKHKNTSWGAVSKWYDKFLEEGKDTYQECVILPNLLRLLSIKKGDKILHLAAGQGFFSRAFHAAGAEVVGVDISEELISKAKDRSPKEIKYSVAPAGETKLPNASFDAVVIVLALQNIEDVGAVFAECRRVLKPDGRLLFVLNHPVFRVPKHSSWGFDDKMSVQYRRVDAYLGESRTKIDMHPGQETSGTTISFHRSLQVYVKALAKNNFAITRLEEWISHKKSEKGPRREAEDRARKEIPLFLFIEAKVNH